MYKKIQLFFASFSTLISLVIIQPANAQDIFSNPFMSSEAIIASRADTQNARTKIVYEVTTETERGTEVSEKVFLLSTDWAAVRTEESTRLFDFRLNRLFHLDGAEKKFLSSNLVAEPMMRVFERQNRNYLYAGLEGITPQVKLFSCNDSAELGVIVGAQTNGPATRFEKNRSTTKFFCNESEMGSFVSDERTTAVPSFWPTLARSLDIHPQMIAEMKATNQYPTSFEAKFKRGDTAFVKTKFRMKSIETVSEPYPLSSQFVNSTATYLDGFTRVAFSQIAKSAIDGEVESKARTWEQWNQFIEAEIQRSGRAEAALNVFVGYAMYPERVAPCFAGQMSPSCGLLKELHVLKTQSASLGALVALVNAKTKQAKLRAIDSVAPAAAEPNFPHPVLGASLSLLLEEGDDEIIAYARSKGVYVNPRETQMTSIAAYPYTPSYWVDLADGYLAGYHINEALLLIEIAASLPVNGSRSGYEALDQKRALTRRIKADFPQFFLN